ncbi:hypothetical protein AA0112_g7413 [Alternaria arborescens]|uniref:hypothetical protein n=1 Tax=Alternaria arborescens TaxID=156630 RepID=UPI001074C194|nr:hypothetical protein AA0111_g7924 [Alternaria arborescens]RYN28501.1 hypothetical protein AA0112_g7413 [Alternaria arborescens]RYO26645.1 hypothetical protein AA0111_g7924 [Alternaria arborescens]
MSGFEVAGVAIGIAPIVFKAVAESMRILEDTIRFDDDAEDLVIRIETAKVHLSIWATSVGLAEGELVPALHPINDLIVRTLQRIELLVTNLEQHGNKYGLQLRETVDAEPKRTSAMALQMRRSLHRVLRRSDPKRNLEAFIQAEKLNESVTNKKQIGVASRLFWAVRDKEKFEHFVYTLETHISGLHKLVFEDQRKEVQQEETRFSFHIVQEITDIGRLSLLQNSPPDERRSPEVDVAYLAQCKAITLQEVASLPRKSKIDDWSLSDTTLADLTRIRFLKPGHDDPGVAYLYEKKEYDPNISEQDKDILHERIRRLVSLLGKPGSQRHLQTLQAVGYTDDPGRHCWWIVFRFPLSPLDTLGSAASEPLSLRKLFDSPFKPALETRYRLARRIAYTFAKLYGSNWMHKGINSNNIIFPEVYTTNAVVGFRQFETALVQGFGYSRQYTEAQTIDRGKVLHDLEAAIYRHPLYQGETASGYQIHYDIYSLGLVLFEIALWSPLMALLAAKYKPGKVPPVALSPDMKQFYELEAKELHRRVNLRVDAEVAYRVGTKYKNAVHWCLNLKGPVTAIDFYNIVAVPLDDLCSSS